MTSIPSTSRVISAQTCLCCGSGPLLGLLVPQHLVDDVLGLPHERLDGVDRPDAGHLLLVRLLPLGPAVVGPGAVLRRSPHRHPLAVGGDDHQRAFLLGRGQLQGRPGTPGHSPPRPGSSAPRPGSPAAAPGASPATDRPRRTTPSGRAAGPSPPARRRSPPRAGPAARPAAPARSSGPPGCRRRPGRWSTRRRSTRSGGRGARAVGGRCGPRAVSASGPRSPSPWAATKADSRVWPEAEQLPEEFPLHGVDPLAVSGRLLDEVPQGVELVLGLEGGLLGCDDHGEVPWVRSHRMCRDRCSAPEGPRFPLPTATTPCQQTKSRGAGGGLRPMRLTPLVYDSVPSSSSAKV